ncbi:MAG: quinolinate synthase NadA [Candidatus Rifleibacteriota bacterium]
MIDALDFANRIKKHFPSDRKTEAISEPGLYEDLKNLFKSNNAVLIAHYYTDPMIQKLAEESGGFVGDSLEMARFGSNNEAEIIIVAGVKFMGETAKILSPNKTVLMPDLGAECSLDLGCREDEFGEFCKQHPDRKVVVYANTSARVKALADWVVTSSIAVDVVKFLAQQNQKVIWAPDRYLGDYIKRQTGADMLLWNAFCIVHAEFDAVQLAELKEKWPDAPVLVHPESQPEVIAMADVVGSTSQLLKATQSMKEQRFIVATESGILYKMQQASPDKQFIFAPTRPVTDGARCDSECPWMKLNSLEKIKEVLTSRKNTVELPQETIQKALIPLQRMVSFRK